MAKITHGPTVTNARGKIGDTVFTKARGGNVAKALSVYGGLGDPVTILHGGTGTATPTPVAGAGITFSGSWPNQTISNTWGPTHVTNTPLSSLYFLVSSSSAHAAWVPGPLAIALGGTGTVTGSITGTGALTFAAGGSNQNVTLTPSGSGYTILNGKVGIKETQPQAILHINAGADSSQVLWELMLNNTRNDSPVGFGTGLKFKNAIFQDQRETNKWAGLAGISEVAWSEDMALAFYTNASAEAGAPSEKMRLTGDGKLAIGTTAPTAVLHAVGITEHADNAAAITAGLTAGAIYRTGDVLKIVH